MTFTITPTLKWCIIVICVSQLVSGVAGLVAIIVKAAH
jgi:hypothetical protein